MPIINFIWRSDSLVSLYTYSCIYILCTCLYVILLLLKKWNVLSFVWHRRKEMTPVRGSYTLRFAYKIPWWKHIKRLLCPRSHSVPSLPAGTCAPGGGPGSAPRTAPGGPGRDGQAAGCPGGWLCWRWARQSTARGRTREAMLLLVPGETKRWVCKIALAPLTCRHEVSKLWPRIVYLWEFSQTFPYLRGGSQLCNNQMKILAVYVVFDISCSHLPSMQIFPTLFLGNS